MVEDVVKKRFSRLFNLALEKNVYVNDMVLRKGFEEGC